MSDDGLGSKKVYLHIPDTHNVPKCGNNEFTVMLVMASLACGRCFTTPPQFTTTAGCS